MEMNLFVDKETKVSADFSGIWYHGTLHKFDVFKPSVRDIGFHFGSLEQAKSRVAFYNPVNIKHYIMQVELNCKSPLILYDDIFTGVPYTFLQKLYSEETVSSLGAPIFNDEDYDILMGKWESDFEESDYWYTNHDYNFYRDVENILISKGFDSIYYLNTHEGELTPNSYSWCVLKPEQIKIIKVEESIEP